MLDAAVKVVKASKKLGENMSILVNKNSRVIVQGITGSEGILIK